MEAAATIIILLWLATILIVIYAATHGQEHHR